MLALDLRPAREVLKLKHDPSFSCKRESRRVLSFYQLSTVGIKELCSWRYFAVISGKGGFLLGASCCNEIAHSSKSQ